MSNRFRFLTIFFSAITLSALIVQLLELRVNINVTKEGCRIVPGIYRRWVWLGIFEIGSAFLTGIWAFKEKEIESTFTYLMISFVCFAVSTVIFFLFTLPVNLTTSDWTQMRQGCDLVRQKWDYSHAINAALYLTGFGFLSGAVLLKNQKNNIEKSS